MKVFYTALFCVAGALASQELNKNESAGGYFIPAPAQAQPLPANIQGQQLPPFFGFGGYTPYLTLPQLEDRNVCDLDASVLLVTEGRPYAPNPAARVRCSEIASYDEQSCNVCCQHSARRDLALKNADIIGFLAVVDTEEEQPVEEETEEETDGERTKRSLKAKKRNNVEPTFLNNGEFTPAPLASNVKCVCCAPKRPLPTPQQMFAQQAAASPVPTYGAPLQAPAQAFPTPVQTQVPTYGAPVAAAPMAVPAPVQAPVPTYGAPVQASVQAAAPVPVQAPVQAAAPAYGVPVPAAAAPQPVYTAPAPAPVAAAPSSPY